MLNLNLYDALEKVFGDVLVSNAGQIGTYSLPIRKTVCFQRKQREYAQVDHWGESYHVNCPVCGDTKHRLYFSHLFGARIIPKNKKTPIFFGRFLVHCFNENCHRKAAMAEWLNKLDDIDGIESRAEIKEVDEHSPAKKTFTKFLINKEVLPTPNLSLISEDTPSNVISFLEGRDFDIQKLDSVYMCRYVPEGAVWKSAVDENVKEVEFYEDRLLIPIFQKRRLVSWQARRLRDSQSSKKKYIFPPGCRVSEYLYNMDMAWKFKNVVICEGVTDVWRIGNNKELSVSAVALFGKHMTRYQMDLFKLLWGYDGKGIVMLDPDASKESKMITTFLSKYKIFPKGVVELRLKDKDPGEHTQEELLEKISGICD
jgi:hypothetical protein